MNALVGEEGDLVLNSEWNREPVERFEDGGDVVVFAHLAALFWMYCSLCMFLPEIPMRSALQ